MSIASKIAIIDTAIDAGRIGGRAIEHINLCADAPYDHGAGISHGTLCAMTLDSMTCDYELASIQIFTENKKKVFTDIELLAEALALCTKIETDIVSLSAVSSILSDSKHLYDITLELAKNAVIVSALDNKLYVSVPTSYPHVIGVRNDAYGALGPGELAHRTGDPLGVDVFANSSLPFIRELGHNPSNSFAAPIVAAYVNELLKKGHSKAEIPGLLKQLPVYNPEAEQAATQTLPPAPEIKVPIVFVSGRSSDGCSSIMDWLYEEEQVQSAALSLVDGTYDVRVRRANGNLDIALEMRFMDRHYKKDLILVTGEEEQLRQIEGSVRFDMVILDSGNGKALMKYESVQEEVSRQNIAERLYKVLSGETEG